MKNVTISMISWQLIEDNQFFLEFEEPFYNYSLKDITFHLLLRLT